MQAELAFFYHWPPSELDAMPVAEQLMWHAQLQRINKVLASKA